MARVAIVTGGTRGIGEAISTVLRDQNIKVCSSFGRGYSGICGNERAEADPRG